jgi:hypothetical protein
MASSPHHVTKIKEISYRYFSQENQPISGIDFQLSCALASNTATFTQMPLGRCSLVWSMALALLMILKALQLAILAWAGGTSATCATQQILPRIPVVFPHRLPLTYLRYASRD